MELKARRVYRFTLVMTLSATVAFALQLSFTLLPPVLAILLSLKPAPPPRFKGLLAIVMVVLLTTGMGVLLGPLLQYAPVSGVLLVLLGLYASSYLMVNLNQGALGAFLAMGFTLISSLGVSSPELAQLMVETLAGSVIIVILCQWLVYPFFPEDPIPPAPAAPTGGEGGALRSNWIALRSTFIVAPVYLVALSDPSTWLAALMKALTLGQQRSWGGVREAGMELLGSTFLGGCLAVLFWMLLGILPNLWMIFLLSLLLGLLGGARLLGVTASRFPPSFWSNTLMTLWIMLAPALADAASGKDVYKAFLTRFVLFLAITLYAWFAIVLLESWRRRHRTRRLAAVRNPS